MSKVMIPAYYEPKLSPAETEVAIKQTKDIFESSLAAELRLRRVTAPIVVLKGTGINDDLNGVERAVTFPVKDLGEVKAEVVHSLAKWKRLALRDLGIETSKGIYTDMNALRPDEELSNLHSIYVDQWDWEKAITKEDRTLAYLKRTVNQIYHAVKRTAYMLSEIYPTLRYDFLPEEITFIQAEDLLKEYPTLSPKEREDKVAKKYGAVFLIGIGGKLSDGNIHDGRAPDYDDWTTKSEEGYFGLNGDIILWHPVLEIAFEVSSMGIRVDETAMEKQLEISGQLARKELFFHKELLSGSLPYSIGGGIGQSRLCMYLLQKAHIGEVQAGIWPESMREECKKHKIFLF